MFYLGFWITSSSIRQKTSGQIFKRKRADVCPEQKKTSGTIIKLN